MNILEILAKGDILMTDCAMGTTLIDLGLGLGECPETWCFEHAEDIAKLAKDCIDAGSNIITTNSFGANRFKFAHYGLEDVRNINIQAAKIARSAADDSVFVAGSVGPTGKMLLMGDVTEDEMYDAFKEQVTALHEGGADLILIETMSDIEEAEIAVKAAKERTPLPVAVTFAFDKTVKCEYRTMMGVSPADMAQAMQNAGADIIGANCGNGIENMVEITKEIRETAPNAFILIQANAGMPKNVDGKDIFPATAQEMSGKMGELIDSGANIIGGCCGTTPAHITAMKKAILR